MTNSTMSYGALNETEEDGKDNTDAHDKKAVRKLYIAIVVCTLLMIAEIVGGAIAGSLAVMTDAAHLLTDIFSFIISIVAIYLQKRPPSIYMTYGWHRAEVVGAVASVFLTWVITFVLLHLAVLRIVGNDYEIDGKIMLITSSMGVVVNIIMMIILHQHPGGGGPSCGTVTDGQTDASINSHGHSHSLTSTQSNLNVRAAFIHAVGDLVQSFGVFAASVVVFIQPKYKICDSICTFIFSVLVFVTTFGLIKDTVRILMEAAPKSINMELLTKSIGEVSNVEEIKTLRVMSLNAKRHVCCMSVVITPQCEHNLVIKRITQLLKAQYGVHEVTVQAEPPEEDGIDDDKAQQSNNIQ